MRLRHTLAIHVIDLAVIAIALFLVSTAVYRSAINTTQFLTDMTWIFLIVLLTYGAVICITEFLLMGIGGNESWFFRMARTALATGFVLWLYPVALRVVLFLLGYEISADVESTLFYTIIIRTVVRALLGRRWHTNE